MERWAASGAMALTGHPDVEPLGPPAGLVPKLDAVADLIAERSVALGDSVTVDPLDLLTERAALAGLRRGGRVSCGGATRLLEARGGWLAVSLARQDDAELVPAWLRDPGLDLMPGAGVRRSVDWRLGEEAWAAIGEAVSEIGAHELVERGVLLGLPVAGLPSGPVVAPVAPEPLAPLPLRAPCPTGARVTAGSGGAGSPTVREATDPRPVDDLAGLTVVDLSSLWAGPLCGSLLAAAGADVVKVESLHRPDGARRGPATFFDLMNAGKRSVALDLQTAGGRRALRALVVRADVVIEASRPRALEQLGIHADQVLGRPGRPRVWVSITGHGRTGDARDRVAFGDDAAVAGGLVSWDDSGDDDPGPCFCADAVADPATGLVAAAAVLDALAVGGRWLLDVAMAGVAAHLAGPTSPRAVRPAVVPDRPRARRRPLGDGRAPALGADTDTVLARVGGT